MIGERDMLRIKTYQSLFKRYRRPGDIVFAWIFLIVSIFLLFQLFDQTAYKNGGKLFAQPRFWPAVSLLGMLCFAALHLIGSACSDRIEGRWREVLSWFWAVEYAVWFMVYAAVVPYSGYLLTTLLFTVLLALRAGYRSARLLWSAVGSGLVVVLLFKTLLKVNLPAGRLYEVLPDGLRQFMLTYF